MSSPLNLQRKRLGRIERQLLLEAAPAGAKTGTVILPPFLTPRQASNRAVRTLEAAGLIEVSRGSRVTNVRERARSIVLDPQHPSWLRSAKGEADAARRFLFASASESGTIALIEYLATAGLSPETVEEALRHFDGTAGDAFYAKHLRLRRMRRTILGQLVAGRCRHELRSALTPGPLDRIRWDRLTVQKLRDGP